MSAATKPRSYPHAAAIKSALTTAGLRIGDHKAPLSDDRKRLVGPCVVLYMTPSAPPFGSVGKPDTEALLRFRLIGMDITADGAMHQSDRAFDALDGAELLVEGRGIHRVRRTAIGGVERDDDLTPPVYYCSTPWSMLSVSSPQEEP